MKKLKVCYFGVGEITGKNKTNVIRMEENNCELSYVFVENKLTMMASGNDAGLKSSLQRILQKTRIIPEILRNIQTLRNCDLIYVGFPGHFDMPAAFIVSRIFGKPLVFDPVITLIDTFAEDVALIKRNSLKAVVLKRLEQFFYNLADIILLDTEVLKRYFRDDFGVDEKKLKVIPLGADEKIYKMNGFKKFNPNDFKVVYYGLYNPLHGVEYIIEAAKKLKNIPGIKFLLIGNGKTYPEMLAKAKKNNLTNVQFFPDMMEKDALKTLQDGDVFLGFLQSVPSVKRFIPNKVFQGMALGKAVITADSEVMRETFIDNENIMLCLPKDGESVADAVKKLRDNPKTLRKISENSYKLFVKNYSMKQIGKKLTETLREAVKLNESV